MTDTVTSTGKADSALDQLLNDELDKFNATATSEVAPVEQLTVRVEQAEGLVAGVSGWTWGQAAGVGMTWVREDHRGTGVGTSAMTAFENEARSRGCTHVFVTSFTFQAPGFCQRLGYRRSSGGSRCRRPAETMFTCGRSSDRPRGAPHININRSRRQVHATADERNESREGMPSW
jgi:GNAT superfamily N-acetyltransferase